MTQNKNSVLNPVGKVTSMKVSFPQIGEMTIGIAHIDLSRAPEGSDLFVQPSEGRLKLEIEVANDNALKWEKCWADQTDLNKGLLEKMREYRGLLQDLLDTGAISCGARRKIARELLSKE